MTSLVSKIAALNFFKTDGRSITVDEGSVQENSYLVHALYNDSTNPTVINSVLVVRGGYRPDKNRQPGYIVITTGDINLKYDTDESKITISLDKNAFPSNEKTTIEFDLTCQEDTFFQESLITDMGALTYDYIDVCHTISKIVKEHDEALLA